MQTKLLLVRLAVMWLVNKISWLSKHSNGIQISTTGLVQIPIGSVRTSSTRPDAVLVRLEPRLMLLLLVVVPSVVLAHQLLVLLVKVKHRNKQPSASLTQLLKLDSKTSRTKQVLQGKRVTYNS